MIIRYNKIYLFSDISTNWAYIILLNEKEYAYKWKERHPKKWRYGEYHYNPSFPYSLKSVNSTQTIDI
jgi:hypothetical protein